MSLTNINDADLDSFELDEDFLDYLESLLPAPSTTTKVPTTVLQQKRRGRPRSKPPKTSFKKAKEEEDEEIPFAIFSREFRFNERLEARKSKF